MKRDKTSIDYMQEHQVSPLFSLLASWEPLNEEFPEISDLPLDDIRDL